MTAIDNGWITFVQNRLPALLAGEYTITVDQAVKNTDPDAQDPGGQAYIDHRFTSEHGFAVTGPRFFLQPNEFHSVFPPNQSQGEYADVLPHIVLTNATMPWQRSADEADGTPWLALLVVHADDGVADSVAAQVGDLQRAGFVAGSGSTKRASTLPNDAATYPKLALDYGESLSDNCHVVDVPVEVFSAAIPALADLQWLAHDRTVTPTRPANPITETASTSASSTYSVVVANRLPKDDAECTVHLVSLENMSELLPTIDKGLYSPASITVNGGPLDGKAAKVVRLVSLKTWKFRPVEPTETFDGYLEQVDTGPLQRRFSSTPGSDAGRAVENAFALGFTALEHSNRLGGKTVSWVRGPLLPYNTGPTIVPLPDPDTGTTPIQSADAAVRYDPDTAMFDVTYAAAWQIGRLLALATTSFSTALYDWKRTTAQQTILALERDYLNTAAGDALGSVAHGGGPTELLHDFMQVLATRAAPSLSSSRAASDSQAESPSGAQQLRPRRALFDRHRRLLGAPDALLALHANTAIPSTVTSWLDQLRAFHGLPFGYLVADESMLPTESIRFFQVDTSWVDALVEGALSLGSSTAGDAAHTTMLRTKLSDPKPAMSGFLLRSGVVAGWPQMKVSAFDANDGPLKPVRVEPITSTILLALFEGTIAKVHLMEPPIGLHFGVQNDKPLRYVTVPAAAPADSQPGDQIPAPGGGFETAGAVAMRADGYTVAVAPHANVVKTALDAAHGNDQQGTTTPRTFTTAEFTLELVEGVQEFQFVQQAESGA